MAWRLAKSLETLRAQINAAAPHRSKVSDGTIGDVAHRNRKSDHNPLPNGAVLALDITHDPGGGCDANSIAESLKASGDRRIKYLIWNKRIWNPSVNPEWRRYSGANPHTMHVHISVKQTASLYDDPGEWLVVVEPSTVPVAVDTPRPTTKPTLRQGSKGTAVRELQQILGVTVDGDFGPKTKAAVIAFQKAQGLVGDGIVGPYTHEALLEKGASTSPETPPVGSLDSEPRWAINFLESLGWPKLVSTALAAHLIWESGGSAKKPATIVWNAHGDKGSDGKYHSHGAPQWNDRHGRWQAYEAFAESRGTAWEDRESQLRYLDHELRTTEKGVAKRLREASTIEEATRIAVDFWRPSVPHLDKRLAIARSLDT